VRAVNWLFRNPKTGNITIVQLPNVSLGVFIAAVLVRVVVRPSGGLRGGVSAVATVALTCWAVDEIVRGVNPWRRFLGGAVLTLTVIGLVR
jgi:hypothetical protein